MFHAEKIIYYKSGATKICTWYLNILIKAMLLLPMWITAWKDFLMG